MDIAFTEAKLHMHRWMSFQANNYNVEICSKGCLEEGMDTMALKLLSTRRHFEELEEYRAPSIQT